jgi:hypothetical protein
MHASTQGGAVARYVAKNRPVPLAGSHKRAAPSIAESTGIRTLDRCRRIRTCSVIGALDRSAPCLVERLKRSGPMR